MNDIKLCACGCNKVVRKYNIYIHGHNRKNCVSGQRIITVDETVFDILTPIACYWVGFLVADGCLKRYKNKYKRIYINLCYEDYAHVVKFKNFLKCIYDVCLSANLNVALDIRSDKLYDRLIEFGLCERKSYNDFKILSNILLNSRDFWRGVVDGDGHLGLYISYNCVDFSLVGRMTLLSQFQQFIFSNLGYKIGIYNHGNVHRAKCAQLKAVSIIKLLYNNADEYLDRKMIIANQIFLYGDYRWKLK